MFPFFLTYLERFLQFDRQQKFSYFSEQGLPAYTCDFEYPKDKNTHEQWTESVTEEATGHGQSEKLLD